MRILLFRKVFTFSCKSWSFLGLRFGPVLKVSVRIDYYHPHDFELNVLEQSRPTRVDVLKMFEKEIEIEKNNIIQIVDTRNRIGKVKNKFLMKMRRNGVPPRQSFEDFRYKHRR